MPDSCITKKALATAMKELMSHVPFAKISVGDICEKCSMNRKSFYYHFKDKYELVNWIFYTEFVATLSSPGQDDSTFELLSAVCHYLYENRTFYTNALQVTGQNSFREYFQEVLTPVVVQYLQRRIEEQDTFFVEFYLDAFLLAIEHWLTRQPCRPPDEFVRLLPQSLMGVAKQIVHDLGTDL